MKFSDSPVKRATRNGPGRGWLGLILLTALALRLMAFGQLRQTTAGFMVGDGFFYHILGKNILHGRYQISPEKTPDEQIDAYKGDLTQSYIFSTVPLNQPTNYWSPGYPAFLALLYLMLGVNPWVASLLGSLMGTGCCFLLWKIAGRISGPLGAALVAGIWAVHPVAVRSSVRLESETPAMFLLLLLVYFSLVWRRDDENLPLSRAIIMGVLGGILFLVRSTMALWTVGLAISFLRGRNKRGFVTAVVLSAAFLMTILPWGFRNQASMGEFMLLETRGVNVLYGELTANLKSVGRYSEMTGTTEIERWREQKRFALELIASQPMLLWRLAEFNVKSGFFPIGNRLHSAFYLLDLIIMFCVIAGIYSWRAQWRSVQPIVWFLILHTFFILLLLKGYESRFRMMSEWPALIAAVTFILNILSSMLNKFGIKQSHSPGR